jgi:hypothetical protein
MRLPRHKEKWLCNMAAEHGYIMGGVAKLLERGYLLPEVFKIEKEPDYSRASPVLH